MSVGERIPARLELHTFPEAVVGRSRRCAPAGTRSSMTATSPSWILTRGRSWCWWRTESSAPRDRRAGAAGARPFPAWPWCGRLAHDRRLDRPRLPRPTAGQDPRGPGQGGRNHLRSGLERHRRRHDGCAAGSSRGSVAAGDRDEIRGLNDRQQAELVALLWLGRGDAEPEEWEATVELARERLAAPVARYLLAEPLVAEYLVEGLDKLGLTVPIAEVEERRAR